MPTLPEILDLLTTGERAALAEWSDYDDGVYLIRPTIHLSWLASLCSKHLGGQWWTGAHGITWVCGRKVCWLVCADNLPVIEECRGVAARLGITCGWTVGGVARALLRWVDVPLPRDSRAKTLIAETGWHYFLASPGSYRAHALYDMRSAYYSLCCKLPSLRLHVGRQKLLWGSWLPGEEERWRAVLAAVEPVKLLRNSLVGVGAGRADCPSYWHAGVLRRAKAAQGAFPSCALLVVRSCWELCWLAANMTDAVYANTDCVICPDNRYPDVWAASGISLRKQGYGDTDIRGIGVYRCGGYRTKYWLDGSRSVRPTPGPPRPQRWYIGEWLITQEELSAYL